MISTHTASYLCKVSRYQALVCVAVRVAAGGSTAAGGPAANAGGGRPGAAGTGPPLSCRRQACAIFPGAAGAASKTGFVAISGSLESTKHKPFSQFATRLTG
jgi:hypothetical protein